VPPISFADPLEWGQHQLESVPTGLPTSRAPSPCSVGCCDFHIFSQSYQVSPIPAFLRTLVLRKNKNKDCHFGHFGRIFLTLSKICIFSTFQNQFSQSVLNHLYKIFRESSLISSMMA
jgi:hypothetical protein